VSDDAAFKILRASRRWDPRDLSSSAQRELQRGNRVNNFMRQHREAYRDPMSYDLVGWDENLAKASPWPWCAKCKTVVRKYGVENRDSMLVTVWAVCHGTKQEVQIEKPSRDIDKRDEGWLRRRIHHLVFFAG
jgi:hypothetical protein